MPQESQRNSHNLHQPKVGVEDRAHEKVQEIAASVMKYKFMRDPWWCYVWILWLLRSLWVHAWLPKPPEWLLFYFHLPSHAWDFQIPWEIIQGRGFWKIEFPALEKCSNVAKLTRGNSTELLISQRERQLEIMSVWLGGKIFSMKYSRKKTEQFLKCLLYLKTLRKKTNKRYPKMFHLCLWNISGRN